MRTTPAKEVRCLDHRYKLKHTPFSVFIRVEINKHGVRETKIQLVTENNERLNVAVHQLAAYPDANTASGVQMAALTTRCVKGSRAHNNIEWEAVGGRCEPRHVGLAQIQQLLEEIISTVSSKADGNIAHKKIEDFLLKNENKIATDFAVFTTEHKSDADRFAKPISSTVSAQGRGFRNDKPVNVWYLVAAERAAIEELKEETCFLGTDNFNQYVLIDRQAGSEVVNNNPQLRKRMMDAAAIAAKEVKSANGGEQRALQALQALQQNGVSAAEFDTRFRTFVMVSKNIIYVANPQMLDGLCFSGEPDVHDKVAFRPLADNVVANYVRPRNGKGDGFYKFSLGFKGTSEPTRAGSDAVLLTAAVGMGVAELPAQGPMRSTNPEYQQLVQNTQNLAAAVTFDDEKQSLPVSSSSSSTSVAQAPMLSSSPLARANTISARPEKKQKFKREQFNLNAPTMLIGVEDETGKKYWLKYNPCANTAVTSSHILQRNLVRRINYTAREAKEDKEQFYKRERDAHHVRMSEHRKPYTRYEQVNFTAALQGLPLAIVNRLKQDALLVQKVKHHGLADQFFCDLGVLTRQEMAELAKDSQFQADWVSVENVANPELNELSQQIGHHPLHYLNINGAEFAVAYCRKNPDGVKADVNASQQGLYRPTSLIIKYKNEQGKWVTIPIHAPWFNDMVKEAPGIIYSVLESEAATYSKRNNVSGRLGGFYWDNAKGRLVRNMALNDPSKVVTSGEYLSDVGGKTSYSLAEFLFKTREMNERSLGVIPDLSTKELCLMLAKMYCIENQVAQFPGFRHADFRAYLVAVFARDSFSVPLQYLQDINVYRPAQDSDGNKQEPWPERFTGREEFVVGQCKGHDVAISGKLPPYIQAEIMAELQLWDNSKALEQRIHARATNKMRGLTYQVKSKGGGVHNRYSRETPDSKYGIGLIATGAINFLKVNKKLPADWAQYQGYDEFLAKLISSGAIISTAGGLTIASEDQLRESLREFVSGRVVTANYGRVRGQIPWVEALGIFKDESAFRGFMDHDEYKQGQGGNYHYFMFAADVASPLERQDQEQKAQLEAINGLLEQLGLQEGADPQYHVKASYWHNRLILVSPFKTAKDDKPHKVLRKLYQRISQLTTRPPSRRKATAMFPGDQATPSAKDKNGKVKVWYNMITSSVGAQHLIGHLNAMLEEEQAAAAMSVSVVNDNVNYDDVEMSSAVTNAFLGMPLEEKACINWLKDKLDAVSANGQFDQVKEILTLKPELATVEFADGDSLLHRAVKQGHFEGARFLLNNEMVKAVDMVRWNTQGLTVLHCNALTKNHQTQLSIFKLLYANGVNLNTPTAPGAGRPFRPLQLFKRYAPPAIAEAVAEQYRNGGRLYVSVDDRNDDLQEQKVARVGGTVSVNGQILATSAQGANTDQPSFNLAAVKHELEKNPASINSVFNFGVLHRNVNLLHWAIHHRHAEAIKYLCAFSQQHLTAQQHQNFLTHQDKRHHTPLHAVLRSSALLETSPAEVLSTVTSQQRQVVDIDALKALLVAGATVGSHDAYAIDKLQWVLIEKVKGDLELLKLISDAQSEPGQVLTRDLVQSICEELTADQLQQLPIHYFTQQGKWGDLVRQYADKFFGSEQKAGSSQAMHASSRSSTRRSQPYSYSSAAGNLPQASMWHGGSSVSSSNSYGSQPDPDLDNDRRPGHCNQQ